MATTNLTTRVEELEKLTGATNLELAETVRDIDSKHAKFKNEISILERKSRGITTANQRIAVLEAEHQKLVAQVLAVLTRIESLPNLDIPVDDAHTSAFQAELKRIDDKMTNVWSDLNTEIDQLKQRVDEHDGVLSMHAEQIADAHNRVDGHDGLFEELKTRVGIVGEATASAHARVDVLFRHVFGIPGWVYPVGGVVGVIAGLIWYNHNWTKTIRIGEVATTITPPAAEWWAAVLCGFSFAWLAIAVLATVFKQKVDPQLTSASASADAWSSRIPRLRRRNNQQDPSNAEEPERAPTQPAAQDNTPNPRANAHAAATTN